MILVTQMMIDLQCSHSALGLVTVLGGSELHYQLNLIEKFLADLLPLVLHLLRCALSSLE